MVKPGDSAGDANRVCLVGDVVSNHRGNPRGWGSTLGSSVAPPVIRFTPSRRSLVDRDTDRNKTQSGICKRVKGPLTCPAPTPARDRGGKHRAHVVGSFRKDGGKIVQYVSPLSSLPHSVPFLKQSSGRAEADGTVPERPTLLSISFMASQPYLLVWSRLSSLAASWLVCSESCGALLPRISACAMYIVSKQASQSVGQPVSRSVNT